MRITRQWAMPSHRTFDIRPIEQLLNRYVGDGVGWADPFSNNSVWAQFSNDINSKYTHGSNLDAHDFAKNLGNVYGVLFDPPYSLEQLKRSYEDVGRKFTMRDGQICNRWTELKNELSKKIQLNGLAISFGWNTEGFGKKRGFEKLEILIVAHGSGHNDTLVVVERKFMNNLFE